MIATEAQREAIDSLLTFIEEATSLRQTAARHLSRCGRLLRLPELEAAVPGLVAGDPTGADADLVCRIEKLEMPPCPPIPESLAPYATGDWRAPEWTPDWKALPDPAEHPESAELYETLADWLRIRGSWLEARGEILPNHALFERLQDLRDHLSESNLRDECVIGTAVFTSNPDVTRAKNPVRWPLLVQPLVIELGSSRRNLPVIAETATRTRGSLPKSSRPLPRTASTSRPPRALRNGSRMRVRTRTLRATSRFPRRSKSSPQAFTQTAASYPQKKHSPRTRVKNPPSRSRRVPSFLFSRVRAAFAVRSAASGRTSPNTATCPRT